VAVPRVNGWWFYPQSGRQVWLKTPVPSLVVISIQHLRARAGLVGPNVSIK